MGNRYAFYSHKQSKHGTYFWKLKDGGVVEVTEVGKKCLFDDAICLGEADSWVSDGRPRNDGLDFGKL